MALRGPARAIATPSCGSRFRNRTGGWGTRAGGSGRPVGPYDVIYADRQAKALKVYFDTVIVSATVMSDLPPGEMAALEKLVAAFADGKIDIETSRLSWDEQDKAKGTIKSKLLAARERFPVVPNDTKLLGSNTISYEGGFMSAPRLTGIMDEALHKTFCAAGLEDRDAQHLMYAVHDRCDRFVTTDHHFLKSRRPILEASCKGLLIRRPSELVSELKL
jgi:hypothetical protein